jgi:hypothetical protein
MFSNGAWDTQLADIVVFDDEFVAQNVCSGMKIEAGHRQKLHELIIGARGVALNATLHVMSIASSSTIGSFKCGLAKFPPM